MLCPRFNARALYRSSNKAACLLLTDNPLVKLFFKRGKLFQVTFLYLRCRDTRPKLNNLCKLLFCNGIIGGRNTKRLRFILINFNLRFKVCLTFIIGIFNVGGKLIKLF